MTSDSKEPLVRFTVNLIAKAAEALDHAAALSRESKTDTANRAIQLYDFFMEQQARGAKIYLRHQGSDELEMVRIL